MACMLPLTVGGITCGVWVTLVEFVSTINTSWGGSNDISRVISAKLILDVSCWGLLYVCWIGCIAVSEIVLNILQEC